VSREHTDPPVINVALLGAAGRMGRVLMEAAADILGVTISAAVVSSSSPLLGQKKSGLAYTSDLGQALLHSDVLVDFSIPAATAMAIDACVVARKPIIVGVTGLDATLQHRLQTASREIAVLAAPNMSLGAVLLTQLAGMAARVLGEDFAIEIEDRHHHQKKDAPSGTALALGEAVAAGRGVELKQHAVFAAPGSITHGNPGSIRFHSIRQGEIVGDHCVTFTSSAERLELSHHAQSRTAFARGALTAARWIVGQPPGQYAMADVLGLQARKP
jgi:4-hydroxy-tetrahydrodipicolinate reductase